MGGRRGNSGDFEENEVLKKKNMGRKLEYGKFGRDFGGYKD